MRTKRKGKQLCRQMRRTKTPNLDYMVCILLSSPLTLCELYIGLNELKCSPSLFYRRYGFAENRQRENSCQILHLGHQGCCQVPFF